MSARRVLGGVALAMVLLGGCGADRVEGTSGPKIKQLDTDLVPARMLGLDVTREDMSESFEGVEDAFLSEVGLYGLRRNDLLQATLQISRFRDNAPLDKSSFQSSLVNQIGGSRAQAFRMGDATVYRTTGRKQVISVWFEEQTMFVLSVRDTFEQPRSLLRESLEIDA